MSGLSAEVAAGAQPATPFEQRLDRIERTLSITGRRLVQRETGWIVLQGHDGRRRPLMHVAAEEVEALAGQQRVSLQDGGFYVLAGPRVAEPVEERLPIALLLRDTRTVRGGTGFLGLVRRARAGMGPLSLREAAAGLRLAGDAELSQRAGRVTMNWDGVPHDKQRRRGRDGGLTASARMAQRRLNALKLAIGAGPFQLAWAACVEGASLDALRRRFDLGRQQLGRSLASALRDLAAAYDQT